MAMKYPITLKISSNHASNRLLFKLYTPTNAIMMILGPSSQYGMVSTLRTGALVED